MNGGLLVLIIGIIIGLAILLYFTLQGTKKWTDDREIVITEVSNRCSPALNTLPDISGLECCYSGSRLTLTKYYPEIDMVVGPVPISYVEACGGFCVNQVSQIDPSKCVGGVGQDNYTQCLNRLRPVGCQGVSLPVAASGRQYYYGLSATNTRCQLTAPCPAS